jgi:hypothetical protein
MTTLTMRYIKGHFVVTGPDIEPTRWLRICKCNLALECGLFVRM